MRTVLISLSLTLALPLLAACDESAPAAADSAAVERSPDHRYIVKLHAGAPADASTVLPSRGRLLRPLPGASAVVLELPDDAIDAVAAHADVATIEPDRRRELVDFASTADTQQIPYGLDLVQAREVWPDAQGEGMTVCVIDSGLDVGHESLQVTDLSGAPLGWDRDSCGHGTHVTGTISALDNGVGVVGVLPNGVRTHVVKVFGDGCGWSWASDLIDALDACREAGAHVVNMSLGGWYSSATERDAFERAFAEGLLLVAAAGNTGSHTAFFPASYDSVISVAAVDRDSKVASFSTRNDQVELSAPGVDVLSTTPSDCWGCAPYGTKSGTSMAAPHVAGVAALVWSANPAWTNYEIRDALRATARELGQPGRDPVYGFGLVQARSALDFLRGDDECLAEPCDGATPEPGLLVGYAFDDATSFPDDLTERVTVSVVDTVLRTSFFVNGTTGMALADTGWRDEGNAFTFSLRPDAGRTLNLTGLSFDERPSPTGPTAFSVHVEIDGVIHPVGAGEVIPGQWGAHTLDLDLDGIDDWVVVHVLAHGASSDAGTWRLDNVRLLGAVVDAR